MCCISVSGKGLSSDSNLYIDLNVYRCYYVDCIPPAPTTIPPPPDLPGAGNFSSGRPDNVLYWSDIATWKNLPAGWGSNTGDGSYSGALPQDGEDVMILTGKRR